MFQKSHRSTSTLFIHDTSIERYTSVAIRQTAQSHRSFFWITFRDLGAGFNSIKRFSTVG